MKRRDEVVVNWLKNHRDSLLSQQKVETAYHVNKAIASIERLSLAVERYTKLIDDTGIVLHNVGMLSRRAIMRLSSKRSFVEAEKPENRVT